MSDRDTRGTEPARSSSHKRSQSTTGDTADLEDSCRPGKFRKVYAAQLVSSPKAPGRDLNLRRPSRRHLSRSLASSDKLGVLEQGNPNIEAAVASTQLQAAPAVNQHLSRSPNSEPPPGTQTADQTADANDPVSAQQPSQKRQLKTRWRNARLLDPSNLDQVAWRLSSSSSRYHLYVPRAVLDGLFRDLKGRLPRSQGDSECKFDVMLTDEGTTLSVRIACSKTKKQTTWRLCGLHKYITRHSLTSSHEIVISRTGAQQLSVSHQLRQQLEAEEAVAAKKPRASPRQGKAAATARASAEQGLMQPKAGHNTVESTRRPFKQVARKQFMNRRFFERTAHLEQIETKSRIRRATATAEQLAWRVTPSTKGVCGPCYLPQKVLEKFFPDLLEHLPKAVQDDKCTFVVCQQGCAAPSGQLKLSIGLYRVSALSYQLFGLKQYVRKHCLQPDDTVLLTRTTDDTITISHSRQGAAPSDSNNGEQHASDVQHAAQQSEQNIPTGRNALRLDCSRLQPEGAAHGLQANPTAGAAPSSAGPGLPTQVPSARMEQVVPAAAPIPPPAMAAAAAQPAAAGFDALHASVHPPLQQAAAVLSIAELQPNTVQRNRDSAAQPTLPPPSAATLHQPSWATVYQAVADSETQHRSAVRGRQPASGTLPTQQAAPSAVALQLETQAQAVQSSQAADATAVQQPAAAPLSTRAAVPATEQAVAGSDCVDLTNDDSDDEKLPIEQLMAKAATHITSNTALGQQRAVNQLPPVALQARAAYDMTEPQQGDLPAVHSAATVGTAVAFAEVPQQTETLAQLQQRLLRSMPEPPSSAAPPQASPRQSPAAVPASMPTAQQQPQTANPPASTSAQAAAAAIPTTAPQPGDAAHRQQRKLPDLSKLEHSPVERQAALQLAMSMIFDMLQFDDRMRKAVKHEVMIVMLNKDKRAEFLGWQYPNMMTAFEDENQEGLTYCMSEAFSAAFQLVNQ